MGRGQCGGKFTRAIVIGGIGWAWHPRQCAESRSNRHPDPTYLDQVERLRDDITLMRSHPDYHAPERLLSAIKQLIDQRGIDQP